MGVCSTVLCAITCCGKPTRHRLRFPRKIHDSVEVSSLLSVTSHRNWVAKGKWNIYGPVAPRVYPSKYEHGWVGPLGFVVGHKRRRSVTKMWTRCAAMVGIWIKIVLLGMIVSLVKSTKLKGNLVTNANAAFGQVGSLPTRLMKSTVLSLHSGSMKVASWFLPEWIILHDVMYEILLKE